MTKAVTEKIIRSFVTGLSRWRKLSPSANSNGLTALGMGMSSGRSLAADGSAKEAHRLVGRQPGRRDSYLVREQGGQGDDGRGFEMGPAQDVLPSEDLPGGPVQEDFPVGHHDDPSSGLRDDVHVVRHEDDRLPGSVERLQVIQDLYLPRQVLPGTRCVR